MITFSKVTNMTRRSVRPLARIVAHQLSDDELAAMLADNTTTPNKAEGLWARILSRLGKIWRWRE